MQRRLLPARCAAAAKPESQLPQPTDLPGQAKKAQLNIDLEDSAMPPPVVVSKVTWDAYGAYEKPKTFAFCSAKESEQNALLRRYFSTDSLRSH